MSVSEVIHAGLSRVGRSGETGLRLHHLSDDEIAELLEATLGFLETKTARPSTVVEGWSTITGVPGLRRWLAEQADLEDGPGGGDQLRRLRTEIYDLLEERRHIIKGDGPNVPIHLAPPAAGAPSAETVTITPHGAGYGDPESNARVEQAAMSVVGETYRDDGWVVVDVSKQNLGWDLTAIKGDRIEHLEVKGVSGVRPTVLLTPNEHDTAVEDPGWVLAVVTQALTAPKLTCFSRTDTLRHCAAQLYRVALPYAHG